MPLPEAVDAALDHLFPQALEQLKEFVAQPSVSAQDLGIREMADLLEARLRERGFEVQRYPTGGHPVLYARMDVGAPRTVLIYNHYDVQPPEPLDLWETPPFEPTIRDGKLFGRGVADNKGPLTARLLAIQALQEGLGQVPVNVHWLIEGEEEIGSPHLAPFTRGHPELMEADGCIWEFGEIDERGVPILILGLKGICYVELRVQSLSRDAHSSLAAFLKNPAWRLVWALNTLKGPDERIQIAGHYDEVVPLTPEEEAAIAALPDNEGTWKKIFGEDAFLPGLSGREALRRLIAEPTCTICGLTSGYQGPGAKTVLPAEARAKIDFRLVPDMDPAKVRERLRAHLDAHGFTDVEILETDGDLGMRAARTPLTDPFVQLTRRAAEDLFGSSPYVVPSSGGSGPMHLFREHGLPVVAIGPGYPDSRAHAPNENLPLVNLKVHARHVAALLLALGEEAEG